MVSLAGLYEIFERWYAVYFDPATGDAVLGSQGDIWDAQKDMLMDTFGAIFAIIVYWISKNISRLKHI